MALSNMEVFNEYYMPNIIETLAQKVALFNQSTGGAIVLTSQGFDGDFIQRSFFSALHSAQRRVDRYAANGAASATALAQLRESGVKIAGGFGPVLFEPSQMTWLQKPTQTAIEVISRTFSEALMSDQVNTIITCLVAAIENQGAAVVNDVSATAGISHAAFNNTNALFGDHSSALRTQIMNGSAFHKLVGQNITNANRLFVAQNVQVVDVLGRLIVVTDAPSLFEAGDTDLLKVLHLTESAGTVYDGSDMISNIETNNGKLRIETTFQTDYTFGAAVKGYTWDTTNGGKSPTDAELATGTNWDKIATSYKHTAGVLTIGDADL